MNLDELRKKIDALDADLVQLLNQRVEVALEIGKLKEDAGGGVYVPAREREVLERVTALNAGPLPVSAVQAIYREIMSGSLALERETCVAFLGPETTFTHQAARSRFGSSVAYQGCDTIGDVFNAVRKKTADYGVVPIENSTDGAVTHTLDLFVSTPLKICAEIYLPVTHHLMGVGPREAVTRIYSKAEVFGQCRHWLSEQMPKAELCPAPSTAAAVEKARGEQGSAAIASELAAELYDMPLLASDIQDLAGNTTRFLVLANEYGRPCGQDKTSLLFAVRHEVGALVAGLEALRKYDINMTKIESRPSKATNWEYFFFVDIEGHTEEPSVKAALAELSEHCLVMTILGSYPNVSTAGGQGV